ncbi:MAG: DUF975 family protein [Peptostreptococcales bacterium]
MLITNSEIRAKARMKLAGNWATAIGITLLLAVIANAAGGSAYIFPFIGGVFSLFINSAVYMGTIIFCLNLLETNKAVFMDGFKGFEYILKATGAVALTSMFIFLWSLLLVIPGIIKSYSYSQTLYILAENPDMKIMDAIYESRRMMNGAKGKLFILHLSFIGWFLLSVITFGVGFLWLIPYFSVSMAAFYLYIKDNFEDIEWIKEEY